MTTSEFLALLLILIVAVVFSPDSSAAEADYTLVCNSRSVDFRADAGFDEPTYYGLDRGKPQHRGSESVTLKMIQQGLVSDLSGLKCTYPKQGELK